MFIVKGIYNTQLEIVCFVGFNAVSQRQFSYIRRHVQPGGHHPGHGASIPDWCYCGHCREMPTQEESVL